MQQHGCCGGIYPGSPRVAFVAPNAQVHPYSIRNICGYQTSLLHRINIGLDNGALAIGQTEHLTDMLHDYFFRLRK